MNTDTKRVLLVDDNPDDRALVRREAEALFPDAQVIEAGSRKDFEAAAAAGSYDLIVTDLHLKWGNGGEVVSTFRQSCPDCAIIMFTGTGDEMIAVEMMKSGVDDYVVKHARQLPRLRTSMKLAVEAAQRRSELSDRERQLTAALAHKDLLVRELHHRVKNNLQTIITLLDIRARLRGGEVAEDLHELAGRMRALAKVQAQLYDSQRLDRLDFTQVVVEMATELVSVYGDAVRLEVGTTEPIEIDVSRAMPLALICYELLLNAVKHAWPHRREGVLSVSASHTAEGAELKIADDGVGLSSDARGTGFGSKLLPPLAKEANARVTTEAQPTGGIVNTICLQ